MSLVLTEEQELLQADRRRVLCASTRPSRTCASCATRATTIGFSRALWKQMGELGWAGILLPESLRRLRTSASRSSAWSLEECGRTLAPEPFLSTVVLGASAIALGGSEAQKQAILPGVVGRRDAAGARLPGDAALRPLRHRDERQGRERTATSSAARRSSCSTGTSPIT